MPVARGTNAIGTGAFVTPPNVVASEPLAAGLAVGLNLSGEVVPCSAATLGYTFLGFMMTSTSVGAPVSIIAMRGSAVVPVVEGGGPLTPGEKVFLSGTLGEVTHTPPTGAGYTSVQVGIATSATQLVLLTDQRVLLRG
jgi:hypothetical protein